MTFDLNLSSLLICKLLSCFHANDHIHVTSSPSFVMNTNHAKNITSMEYVHSRGKTKIFIVRKFLAEINKIPNNKDSVYKCINKYLNFLRDICYIYKYLLT